MKDAERRLLDIASAQRQVFTRAQAIEAGLTPSGLYRRTTGGLFVPIGPHTLTFAGVTLDWRGRLKAGLLDLGAGALISGHAAARLHELDGFEDDVLSYLVLRSQRKRTTAGVIMSTSTIGPLDKCTIDGLDVTSCTRTVVELLGRSRPDEVGNALDSGTRKRLTAPSVVERRLAELGREGRRGVADFDALMRSAGVESWLERRFLKVIAANGLPRPAIQRTYRADGVHVARVDFDFAPLPIVVEVGGQRGYMSKDERQRQERRRNRLQLMGKLIYFFTRDDVVDDSGYVLDTVNRGIARAS